MWNKKLSRRATIELCLGGYDPRDFSARKTAGVSAEDSGPDFDVYWTADPSLTGAFPTLIVVPDGQDSEFLTAINASPSAPTPFSAFCRVMPHKAAKSYSQIALKEVSEEALRVIAVVSMVEAVLTSDGRLTLKTVSPAACRRTVAFAWGRAAATGVPHEAVQELSGRWLKLNSLLGQQESPTPSSMYRALVGLLGALVSEHGSYAASSLAPVDDSTRTALHMMDAIRSKNNNEIEMAWREMSLATGFRVSLGEIAMQSREDRGTYLQQALNKLSVSRDPAAIPACAFLATQVAPRSFEHLDILRSSGMPEVGLWYAVFAALQNTNGMLQLNGWLGLRVVRDIKKVDEHFSPPTADISYEELNAVARSGLEAISRRLGHGGEIEVEIIPSVTTSFTFQAKAVAPKAGRDTPSRQLPFEPESNTRGISLAVREQIYSALSQIANAIEEPRDSVDLVSVQAPVKRVYRKKS